MVPMVVLQIVNEDDVIEAAGEIPPGRQGDFRVFVGNQFAAADHLLLFSCRCGGSKLRNSPRNPKGAVPFGFERLEELRQELLLPFPGYQKSNPEKGPG